MISILCDDVFLRQVKYVPWLVEHLLPESLVNAPSLRQVTICSRLQETSAGFLFSPELFEHRRNTSVSILHFVS